MELGVPDQQGMAGHRSGSSLAFTVFAGDEDCPRDEEAANLWRSQGVKDDHLFYLPKKHNWWGPAGVTGPCGPDTEMFIITDQPAVRPGLLARVRLRHAIWRSGTTCSCSMNKQADGTFIAPEAEERRYRHGSGAHHLRTDGQKDRVRNRHLRATSSPRSSELSRQAVRRRARKPPAPSASSPTICAPPRCILGDDKGVTPLQR